MVITYKSLPKIEFPVYPLVASGWERADGLLLADNRVVDDKNVKGDTLGVRRLRTPFKELHPLKKQISGLKGILETKGTSFIDNKGVPFIYEKTEFAKLKYCRIKEVRKMGKFSYLFVEGITTPFVIQRPPHPLETWAGVIYIRKNIPLELYEFSESKKSDTRRKI